MAAGADAWGIPPAVITEFGTLAQAADASLAAAKNESARTPVAAARCRVDFEALAAKMRDIKRRYFLMPPLAAANFAALGLKLPDTAYTPGGNPAAQVKAEAYLIGRHELGLKIVYVTGSPADPANKDYRIYYGVIAPGGTPPVRPENLTRSFSTRRKKDKVEFDYEDSGKTAYFAVQVENDGRKGEWGPLVSALIP
jgi:hypothetical protein